MLVPLEESTHEHRVALQSTLVRMWMLVYKQEQQKLGFWECVSLDQNSEKGLI
jgi:hypothetical protein